MKNRLTNNRIGPVDRLRSALFGVLIGLSLLGCGPQAEQSQVPRSILTLNDTNDATFARDFAQDYLATLASLENAYHDSRQRDDANGFIRYRNLEWTPAYIEKKAYYQAVLQKNKPYIYRAAMNPLFDKFDRLITISVNLKHALRDHNDAQWRQAKALIDADKAVVMRQLSAAGESPAILSKH